MLIVEDEFIISSLHHVPLITAQKFVIIINISVKNELNVFIKRAFDTLLHVVDKYLVFIRANIVLL